MTDGKLSGWGYQQIGWLLDQVESAGAIIPEKYRTVNHDRFDIESSREQDAVRQARLEAGNKISFAFTWEALYPDMARDAVSRQRVESAGKIEGQIRRAIVGLRDDKTLLALLSAKMLANPDTGGGAHEAIRAMECTLLSLQSLRQELSDVAPLRDLNISRQGLLFEQLAKSYQEILGIDPHSGMVYSYQAYHGPFVTFLHAAFTLAGKPALNDEAMTKALQRSGFGKAKDNL